MYNIIIKHYVYYIAIINNLLDTTADHYAVGVTGN